VRVTRGTSVLRSLGEEAPSQTGISVPRRTVFFISFHAMEWYSKP
jgi:hypothetical protein